MATIRVTPLKRTIAGVDLYAASQDPAQLEQVRRILDRVLAEHGTPADRVSKSTRELIDALVAPRAGRVAPAG